MGTNKKREMQPQKANVFVWFGKENSDKGSLICKNCKEKFEPSQEQIEAVLRDEKTLLQLDCETCRGVNSGYVFKNKYEHWAGEFIPVTTNVPVNFLPR